MVDEIQQVMTEAVPMIFTHSETIGKIAEAFAKSQGEFDRVTKDTKNPFYKSSYADLASVIGATRAALSQNGIAVIQSPQGDANRKLVIITTLLAHSSGEWFRGELAIPISKWDAQGAGSAITYARRYALQAFLAVAGEDDDGNRASGIKSTDEVEKESKEYEQDFDQRTDNQRVIKEFQVHALVEAAKRAGKTEAQCSAYLVSVGQLKDWAELTVEQFQPALKWCNGATLPQDAQTKSDTPKADEPTERPKGLISSAQEKRLWAIGKKSGFTELEILGIVGRHGFEKASEISWKVYDAVIKDLEGGK